MVAMGNVEIIYTFYSKCQISSKSHASFFNLKVSNILNILILNVTKNKRAQGPWVAHLRMSIHKVRTS